jgi:hypothetical protein
VRDHVRTYGIEHGVAQNLGHVGAGIDESPVETALDQVTLSLVPAIEVAGVGAVEPVHGLTKIRARCGDDEMEVIRHQHPGRDAPPEAERDLAKE